MPETRRAMLSLFLLGMGVLALEVSLTRVFSVMSLHHFAYLIISLALLGFGAASSFLTVAPRFGGERFDDGRMARYALGFCLSTIVAFATATKIRFYPGDVVLYRDYSNIFSLCLLYVIVGVPFFFAGVCIAYLIARAGEAIHRFYFADLLGAGAGALLALLGINHLGVEATLYAVATVGGIVALVYAVHAGRRAMLVLASAGALGLSLLMAVVATGREIFPVYFPPDKIFRLAMEPHFYRWHVVARVDVLSPVRSWRDFGGSLSPRYRSEVSDPDPETRGVYQDGAAGTAIVHVPDGDVRKLPGLGYYLQSAPYVIKAGAERVLVIGVGGGIDVLIGLYHGCRRVTGVEVNPVIVDVVKRRYADFGGRVFDRPDVDLVAAEGRHYLTATDQRFDVIQLSGVDTFSALASGAYALAESYLYTTDAMREYWSHLTEDGVLSFSRWLFDPPRETLRLVTIQVTALRSLGIGVPERHFIVVGGRGVGGTAWAETLLKRSPFTEAEAEAYRRWAERLQFEVLYDPYVPRDNAFDRMIRATDEGRKAMIDGYPYDIRPVGDDAPFFFDYYRWRSLWNPEPAVGQGGYYVTRFPLALMILVASLAQIVLLAALFILGPLLSRGAPLRGVPRRGRVLLYFGALGLGFITVEIVFLQKYTVFVGGPVIAMAVTLFAILVFSGVGSLLAERLRRSIPRSLTWIVLSLVAAIAAEGLFVHAVVPRLMFLPHATRCAVTALALAPLAVLMGMPFPTGLRVAQRLGGAVVPWAWGINATLTTLGSLLCVLASMQWGFNASLSVAGLVYLLGLAALLPVAKEL